MAVIHLTEHELHLGQIIRTLKAASATVIRRFNPDFAWQTDYYDRIVRSNTS
jgi:hypothetical protein